jgi:hypothetical protein
MISHDSPFYSDLECLPKARTKRHTCAGYLGHPFGKIENKQTSAQWRGKKYSGEQGERQHLLLLSRRKPEEDKQSQES